MTNVLYVFSNCGFLNQLPKSGGQTSARRVMQGLEQYGFKTIPIRRHRAEWEGKYAHKVEVLTFAIIDVLKIVYKMGFAKRQNTAFLHLTYAGPLVPYELLLTKIVKLMGFPVLEYLKGGQVLDYYAKGSKTHKRLFKKNIDLQDLVMFEGMQSMKLAESLSNTRMLYFPNYIFDEKIPAYIPQKTTNEINIYYFGRISPDKNIHLGIETFNILCDRHPDWNLHYTIVGGKGKSSIYVEKVEQMISSSPHNRRITRIGNSSQDFLIGMMQSQHIFLFPSKEPCEGHSNALNEAMSQGLIPIVSDYHFNSTIVNNDLCVVKTFTPEAYADKIEQIVLSGNMRDISKQMWNRVKENYSFSKVNKRVCDAIKQL